MRWGILETEEDVMVVNDRGRPFTVRLVFKGGAYGRDGCLVHGEDDPLVEFYDATYKDDAKFAAVDSLSEGRGQFVSRYYFSTLCKHRDGFGLDLMGYAVEWKLDAVAFTMAMRWARLTVEAH